MPVANLGLVAAEVVAASLSIAVKTAVGLARPRAPTFPSTVLSSLKVPFFFAPSRASRRVVGHRY